MLRLLTTGLALLLPQLAFANSDAYFNIHITNTPLSVMALAIFVIAYFFVMTEEFTHLRKSKPVIIAAGLIWFVVAWYGALLGKPHLAQDAVRHNILEFAELFMFLLVAMTYVNAMEERLVFEKLRVWLVQKGFNYRQLFWVTGTVAFFLSPIADNLTTALLMCAVVMAVGIESPKFVAIACVNIVVAANAGGAFSPFGDITTLMVWQKKLVDFHEFFYIFVPSLVSYVIPAGIMHFAIPNERPAASTETITLRVGARRIIVLFLLTLVTTILMHHYLHLPPMIGMMTGLGYLNFFAYYLKKREPVLAAKRYGSNNLPEELKRPFDIFNRIKNAEWDTLFFFYGVILSVGGLATLGYLEVTSHLMYEGMGATYANILVGYLSAIVDNIPVMFAVLTMNPDMSLGQWLLVTLTAGIGGSMLSIGSAAGVALMGASKGKYTFFTHLKWSWAIMLGYIAGVLTHLWMNAHLFT